MENSEEYKEYAQKEYYISKIVNQKKVKPNFGVI